MEQTKIQTVNKILMAKSRDEAESYVVLAIHKLEEHNVNKHLINRFILKLIDLLELKKILFKNSENKPIIEGTICFLKFMNYH